MYAKMSMKKGDHADERYIRPKGAEKKFKLAKELGQTLYLYGIVGSGKICSDAKDTTTILQEKQVWKTCRF